jgi:hypothetical protein
MASAIASIPVLTGDVAEKFEAQATETYNAFLKDNTTIEERSNRYEQGVQMVRKILSKSGL